MANGRTFEDFSVGDVYDHPAGRTVLATDNAWFSLLTLATSPIHIDHHYARQTEFGKPLVNSAFLLALVTGLSVQDVSQCVFANLGWDEVRLPYPVFEGDTIYARSDVIEARPSRSRPNVGLVKIRTTGFNQEGRSVISFFRSLLVYRRGYVPSLSSRPENTQ